MAACLQVLLLKLLERARARHHAPYPLKSLLPLLCLTQSCASLAVYDAGDLLALESLHTGTEV